MQTSLAGIYRVDVSLAEMNRLLYEAATAKRVRGLALRALTAVDARDYRALELAIELIRLVGQEEGWLQVKKDVQNMEGGLSERTVSNL